MAWKYNDRVIRVGRSWQDDDGITHPTNWAVWSDEDKAAAGLVWEDDPAPYDNRFYWDASTPKNINDVNEVDENGDPVLDQDGNQVVTLGLKSQWKTTIKQQAAGLLANTDWYVTRNAETGTAIPADVTTYRAAVRTASGTIEAAIDAAADHAAFVALFDVPLDNEGNATGNAPIADWPEENA
jgi:hypothetical protein